MATSWVKSLHCKSRSVDDVYQPHPRSHSVISSSRCGGCTKPRKDIVKSCSKQGEQGHWSSSSLSTQTTSVYGSTSRRDPSKGIRLPAVHEDDSVPKLSELLEGHSSRNVVEIIFRTSWSSTTEPPGRIEAIFKVQNPPETVSQFEEYRRKVKSRAAEVISGSKDENARCLADGNEVMRFRCVRPSASGICDNSGLCVPIDREVAITTFAGSSSAHDSAGAGKGRRAMLVCRVIAGRVCPMPACAIGNGVLCGFDSASGDNDSLTVFDARALLPCFLVFYKL